MDDNHKPHVTRNTGNFEWYTPAYIIEAARKTMGTIDLDPASSAIANETVKATTFYTIDDDGLTKEWGGHEHLAEPAVFRQAYREIRRQTPCVRLQTGDCTRQQRDGDQVVCKARRQCQCRRLPERENQILEPRRRHAQFPDSRAGDLVLRRQRQFVSPVLRAIRARLVLKGGVAYDLR